MIFSTRNLRIGGAGVLSIIFVSFAYVISGPSFLSTKTVDAASSDELLKAYAAKDSDNDGLPDWQEALYGTDPNKADSTGLGMTDGEAFKEGKLTPQTLSTQLPKADTAITAADLPGIDPTPGSITDEFSKEFLQTYITESKGQPMSADAQQALISKLVQSFGVRAGKVLESKYTIVSVHTDKNIDALTYAASVEKIIRSHDVPAADSQPLPLMEVLIEKNDLGAKPKLVAIADAYTAIAKDLLVTPVPPNLANDHLLLMQSFDSLARSTRLITTYEKDPIGVLGAFTVFKGASLSLSQAFTSIATKILVDGEPANGTPGSLIVSLGRIGQN